MKHCYCPALLFLLLVGCSRTEVPRHVATESVTTVAITEAADTETVENWFPLFDGETTAGWSVPVYGNVDVQEGNLVIGRGETMTGIFYEKEFPKINYEIRYEAQRTQGYDFFAACTFPIKESFCTFVNGGWVGGVTGISSVNGYNASENETSMFYDYQDKTWYRFRIRVEDDMIQVWITAQDKNKNWGEEVSVIELETKDRELTTRFEMNQYTPLGFCTWASEGQLRNIEFRTIER